MNSKTKPSKRILMILGTLLVLGGLFTWSGVTIASHIPSNSININSNETALANELAKFRPYIVLENGTKVYADCRKLLSNGTYGECKCKIKR